MTDISEIREICDAIITDDENKTITIPLTDLIWTIVCYNFDIKHIEEEINIDDAMGRPFYDLICAKNCKSSRIDEIGRIISQYGDFDTQKIYKETRKIHEWNKGDDGNDCETI